MRKITTDERMLSNLVVEYEKMSDPRLPACSRKSGHLLETSCSIMDLKGVGLGLMSSAYGYLQQASAISQNYYPERLGKLYVINAPWGFSSVFNVVKKFLDPVTVAKIHVLGSGYQKDLLSQIPKENLPKAFGGDCECSGPGGCQLSDQGPCKLLRIILSQLRNHTDGFNRARSSVGQGACMEAEEGGQLHPRHRQPRRRGPACYRTPGCRAARRPARSCASRPVN